MDRVTLYIEFAHFYCEVRPYIQGIHRYAIHTGPLKGSH